MRVGDLEDWLTKLGADNGVLIVCDLVDIGYGKQHDLTKQWNVDVLRARCESGAYDHNFFINFRRSSYSSCCLRLPRQVTSRTPSIFNVPSKT